MSLQEEVPVAGLGDAAVDDGPGDWVLAVRVLLCCWVEAGVVALSDDDDGQTWETFLCLVCWVGFLACFLEKGKFLVDDLVVLAL